jgi:hypothetical protein
MIGFCGAHRTGKTTLARAVARHLDLPFCETSAGATFARLGRDPKAEYPFAERLDIQRAILDDMAAAYRATPEGFIADRTPIDMWAYTLAEVGRQTLSPALEHAYRDYEAALIETTKAHFDVAILVQPGIRVLETAGKAPASAGYIEHLNGLVRGLMDDARLQLRSYVIPRNVLPLESRLAVATAHLGLQPPRLAGGMRP